MGYGNAIVSSDIVEAREVVGDAALTFACGDAASLAEQLARIVIDPALAASLRERAVARVRAKYNWDDVAAAHRRVYERVLRDGR
jgi:glycosyltransferase involved in cell wall biosynthesis